MAAVSAAQPLIRTTTRLVEIDVAVRDSHGGAANLAKDDFAIFDNGKRQNIAVFHIRSRPAAAGAPATPSDAVTNQGAGAAAEGVVSTVILLDSLNSDPAEQLQAKAGVLEFLRQIHPPARVAIYSLGAGVQLEQDFTGDSAALMAAVERGRWGAGYEWPKAKKEAEAAAMRANAGPNTALAKLTDAVDLTFNSSNPNDATSQRVRKTCVGLIALAKYLAQTPGRKDLLWMTRSFPLRSGNNLYADEASQVNHALTDAGIVADPIDTRGLPVQGGGTFQAPRASGTPAPRNPGFAPATGGAPGSFTVAPGIGPAGQDTMAYIAHFTGGHAFTDRNNMALAMKTAVANDEAGYILAFYPDSAALDGTRHTLKVTVNRGGLELAYRRGYTAAVEDPAAKVPEKGQVAQALWSPLDEEGIGLTAKTEKVNQPERGLVRLTVTIAGRDVSLQQTDKGWTGELALLFDERASDGRDLGRITETLNLQYDDEHLRKLPEEGVVYPRLVHPSSAAAQVRVVVYDRSSGRLGSLTVPLK